MQSDAGGRYIHSVSDLCGADEIEFLLDDIRDLETVNYRAEDIQVNIYRDAAKYGPYSLITEK